MWAVLNIVFIALVIAALFGKVAWSVVGITALVFAVVALGGGVLSGRAKN